MIATIAEKKKLQRWLSLRSLESGFHMIAAIADFFFSAIAAITAIIWKPSLTVTNHEKICSKLAEKPEGLHGG